MFPQVITSYRWIISFHRPSWDHCGPFQAPVSPKGWPEITQLCKKTTIKDQGELPLQFPSEFIFEEKKCFAAWSKGTYNQLQRICGPFPRLENDHVYIYLHCTMIWHWFSWWWKQRKMKKWRWRWFKVATKWLWCSTADVNWLRRQGEVLSQQHKKGKKWV